MKTRTPRSTKRRSPSKAACAPLPAPPSRSRALPSPSASCQLLLPLFLVLVSSRVSGRLLLSRPTRCLFLGWSSRGRAVVVRALPALPFGPGGAAPALEPSGFPQPSSRPQPLRHRPAGGVHRAACLICVSPPFPASLVSVLVSVLGAGIRVVPCSRAGAAGSSHPRTLSWFLGFSDLPAGSRRAAATAMLCSAEAEEVFQPPLLYLPPLPWPHCSFCSINPVTGRVEEKLPNPMEGMTEDQKEYEAMKLVNMFDKLYRY